jgi:hypothetical protein
VGPALLLELSMPCEVDDNFFDDPRIPYGGNQKLEIRSPKSETHPKFQ